MAIYSHIGNFVVLYEKNLDGKNLGGEFGTWSSLPPKFYLPTFFFTSF